MKFKLTHLMISAAAAGMIALSSCDKVTNPVQDTKDAEAGMEDYSRTQQTFSALADLAKDVMQNDPNMLKTGGYAIIPDGVEITWIDSVFTDGNGIDFQVEFSNIKVEDIEASKLSFNDFIKSMNGTFYAGTVRIQANKKYNEDGLVIQVSQGLLLNKNAGGYTVDGYTLPMVFQSGGVAYAFTNDNKVKDSTFNTAPGAPKYVIVPAPFLTISRKNPTTLKLDYSSRIIKSNWSDFSYHGNYQYTGNYSVSQTAGNTTVDTNDDIYEIKGSSSGFDNDDKAYTMLIDDSKPLVKDFSCTATSAFVKGAFTLTVSSGKKFIIDFGDGSCDAKGTIKYGNLPATDFTLK
ncbi:MAG: hypothetical protein GC180_06810 [Bacteroidetes bacterium]|nr:hypothetical protein [Bacteroidota bacterium]